MRSRVELTAAHWQPSPVRGFSAREIVYTRLISSRPLCKAPVFGLLCLGLPVLPGLQLCPGKNGRQPMPRHNGMRLALSRGGSRLQLDRGVALGRLWWLVLFMLRIFYSVR